MARCSDRGEARPPASLPHASQHQRAAETGSEARPVVRWTGWLLASMGLGLTACAPSRAPSPTIVPPATAIAAPSPVASTAPSPVPIAQPTVSPPARPTPDLTLLDPPPPP